MKTAPKNTKKPAQKTVVAQVSPRPTSTSFWKYFSIVACIVAVLAIAFGVYVYANLQKVKEPDYQQKVVEQQTQDIINEVGRIYMLPVGTPQIAVVSNPDELKKSQPFFEKALNGDQVLVYESEAILYRPSTKQIVNIGPVNRAPTTTPTPAKK